MLTVGALIFLPDRAVPPYRPRYLYRHVPSATTSRHPREWPRAPALSARRVLARAAPGDEAPAHAAPDGVGDRAALRRRHPPPPGSPVGRAAGGALDREDDRGRGGPCHCGARAGRTDRLEPPGHAGRDRA